MAKANAIIEFKASQPFIDAYAIYYGDGFEDCLKQVKSVYPNLDLSKASMNDLLPMIPTGGDTVSEKINDSIQFERDPKDSNVILAQPVVEGPIAPLAPSANNPPPKDIENLSTEDAQNRPVDDENLLSPDT